MSSRIFIPLIGENDRAHLAELTISTSPEKSTQFGKSIPQETKLFLQEKIDKILGLIDGVFDYRRKRKRPRSFCVSISRSPVAQLHRDIVETTEGNSLELALCLGIISAGLAIPLERGICATGQVDEESRVHTVRLLREKILGRNGAARSEEVQLILLPPRPEGDLAYIEDSDGDTLVEAYDKTIDELETMQPKKAYMVINSLEEIFHEKYFLNIFVAISFGGFIQNKGPRRKIGLRGAPPSKAQAALGELINKKMALVEVPARSGYKYLLYTFILGVVILLLLNWIEPFSYKDLPPSLSSGKQDGREQERRFSGATTQEAMKHVPDGRKQERWLSAGAEHFVRSFYIDNLRSCYLGTYLICTFSEPEDEAEADIVPELIVGPITGEKDFDFSDKGWVDEPAKDVFVEKVRTPGEYYPYASVSAKGNSLMAVAFGSASSGNTYETIRVREFKSEITKPLLEENAAYVGCKDYGIYKVDLRSGQILWEFKTQGQVVAAGSMAGGCVLFGSTDGKMYCIEKESGDLVWGHETEGKIIYPPCCFEKKVVFATTNKRMHVVHLDNGQLDFQIGTFGAIKCPIAVSQRGNIYFGDDSGHVFSVSLDNKKIDWIYDIGETIREEPLLHNGLVCFHVASDFYVFAEEHAVPYGSITTIKFNNQQYEIEFSGNIQPDKGELLYVYRKKEEKAASLTLENLDLIAKLEVAETARGKVIGEVPELSAKPKVGDVILYSGRTDIDNVGASAEVFVDGYRWPQGVPFTLIGLKNGKHKINIYDKEKYQWRMCCDKSNDGISYTIHEKEHDERTKLEESFPCRIVADLQTIEVCSVLITTSAPKEASVCVNYEVQRTAPFEMNNLVPGRGYLVKITSPGYKPHLKVYHFKPGTNSISVSLQKK